MKQYLLHEKNSLEPTLVNILGTSEYKKRKYIIFQDAKSTTMKIKIYELVPYNEEYGIFKNVVDKDVYEHFSGLFNSMLIRDKNKNT